MKDNHYIDNEKFLNEIVEYKQLIREAENSGESKPEVPEYIAQCFILISESLSHRYNFINYTWKDEMVSDGIENCLLYVDNFDPNKSKNPFGYFTQIAYYAFVRRIDREKKQGYIKYKLIEDSGVMDTLVNYQEQDENEHVLGTYKEYLKSHSSYNDYYEKEELKKERRRLQRKKKRQNTKKDK